MTSFYDCCGSGPIFNYLNKIYQNFSDYTYVATILKRKYTPKEITSLKSQAGISFPIFIADNILDLKWKNLINSFREFDLNNIIVFYENSGRIIEIHYNGCRCSQKFFKKVEKILIKEKKSDKK